MFKPGTQLEPRKIACVLFSWEMLKFENTIGYVRKEIVESKIAFWDY